MTLQEAMAELEALGNEKMRRQNRNHGSGDNQFGVRRGEVRKIAKKIKSDHDLALELWGTGNIDARFLAVLIMKPKALSMAEMEELVCSVTFVEVADWLERYVLVKHPDHEALREKWLAGASNRMAARGAWALTDVRIRKSPQGLDLSGLLDRIDAEMADAPPEEQWTMNFCLANIGIHHAEHRERALAIGEKLGIYRDYPTSKGCTSPFAPIWINEMVSRLE